jgi:hypothetical protein
MLTLKNYFFKNKDPINNLSQSNLDGLDQTVLYYKSEDLSPVNDFYDNYEIMDMEQEKINPSMIIYNLFLKIKYNILNLNLINFNFIYSQFCIKKTNNMDEMKYYFTDE